MSCWQARQLYSGRPPRIYAELRVCVISSKLDNARGGGYRFRKVETFRLEGLSWYLKFDYLILEAYLHCLSEDLATSVPSES